MNPTQSRTRSLDDIAADNGTFAILAMDQRNTLRRMFTAVGRDGTERDGQPFDRAIRDAFSHRGHQPVARHHAATAERRVDEAPHIELRQLADPLLKRVERARSVRRPDQCADRCTGDDAWNPAAVGQSPDDPDVGPASRRAAAQRQPESRCSHGCRAR